MIKNMFKMTRKRLILDLVLCAILLGLIGQIFFAMWMPGKSYSGSFTGTPTESEIEADLRTHIHNLCKVIGQRNSQTALQASVDYIKTNLAKLGYEVREQEFEVDQQKFRNLEAELKGNSPDAETLLVGAHYDSVTGSPGADDNGSGVATVLELAKLCKDKQHKNNIRFVLFACEEPPYFSSENMGSCHYAKLCKKEGKKIQGILVMETLGYYTDKPDSQTYPLGFAPGYPTIGNFIGFVGNQSSRPLIEKCVKTFREQCDFPSEGISAPDWINGIDWSDQYWFWKNSIPGLMITDTAPYRYPHYHSLQDTEDKLNYPSFAKVVSGLLKVVDGVAN